MKAHYLLKINGQDVDVIEHDIRLDLFSPGRASFVVKKNNDDLGDVTFDIVEGENVNRVFAGICTDRPNRIDDNYQRIFCREYSSILSNNLPLAMRNVRFSDVLLKISTITNLNFSFNPASDFLEKNSPFFYSIGSGYHCLDSLLETFQVDRPVWQQQIDGSIFVGSWNESFWAGKTPSIPKRFFNNHGVQNSATVPIIANLRPGAELDERGIIYQMAIKKDLMSMRWSNNPWTK